MIQKITRKEATMNNFSPLNFNFNIGNGYSPGTTGWPGSVSSFSVGCSSSSPSFGWRSVEGILLGFVGWFEIVFGTVSSWST